MVKVATIKGKVKAISISENRGTRKYNIRSARLKADFGIENDAHVGNWHRQISLLAAESIEKMVKKGADVRAGDFAENITTEGIDLPSLPIKTRLKLGDTAEIEVTQIGKKCHHECEIFKLIGDCVMPKEGIFAKVLKAGNIKTGDTVEVLND